MPLIYQLVVVLGVLECAIAGLSKKEAACFARDQFYHEPTDKCYELLHQGPCPDGEWWVLRKPLKSDKDIIVKGVCEKDQCRDSRLFWPGKGCVSVSQKIELCGTDPRSILTNNDFGEGECMCYKSPPHARLDDNPDNLCYELNLQGPCNRREILAIPPDSSVPKCIADPCFHTAFKLKKANQLPVSAVMAMYNGTCYQLETQGPCPQGQTFKVSLVDRQPDCITLTHTIFNLEKETDCDKDENGECLQIVHLNTGDNPYRRAMVAQLRAYQDRHRKIAEIIIYDSMLPGCEQLTTAIFGDLEKHEENEQIVSYSSDEYKKRKIAAIKRRRRRRMT